VADNDVLAQFDELAEYYKMLPEIPQTIPNQPPARFKLVPVIPDTPAPGDKGTPDIPCQVMMLNGPGT
jgi:hypothetical protein